MDESVETASSDGSSPKQSYSGRQKQGIFQRGSKSVKLMRSMSMGSMDELNAPDHPDQGARGARWPSSGKSKMGNHQYADVDNLLSVSLGSLPKLLGLDRLSLAYFRGLASGAELVSSADEKHNSIPADLVTLSRWRCWLGAYNVDGIKPPENPRNKLQRASSKLIVLKRAGLLRSLAGSTAQGGESDAEAQMNLRKGCTLHVRNISGGVAVGSATETGECESPTTLSAVFGRFGSVEQVTVRHRIQDGRNTSWALVTMKEPEEARKAMEAPSVMAGPHALRIAYLNEDQARTSTGEMQLIRTRHWIGIQNKTLRFGTKKKMVSCGVRYWSWFCWCIAVLGLALVVLLSWYDTLVEYPLAQTQSSTRLPALNVTLTTPRNNTMTMSLTLASERNLATESNEWNGIIDNDSFRSTRLGGGLLLAPERLVALQFEHALLPPGAHIDQAVLVLEAVGQDNRFLSTAPTPLLSPRFGETDQAKHARNAPLEVAVFAALDIAVVLGEVLSLSSLLPSRTHEQALWKLGDDARNKLDPHVVHSTDVSNVLQELVDTPGWSHSSAVTLFVEHVSGEGQVLYTNSDTAGSIFLPMLVSVLWAAVYYINRLFSSKENKMTVLDVQDNKEMQMRRWVYRVIAGLNAGALMVSVSLIYTGLQADRKTTVFFWARQIYLQIVAGYSMNLFAMWLMHFYVACNHLIYVGTQFWLSMSLQTTRTVEALMSRLTLVPHKRNF